MTRAAFDIPPNLRRVLQEPAYASRTTRHRKRKRISRRNRLLACLRRALASTSDLNELGRAFASFHELRLFTQSCLQYATPPQILTLSASSLLSEALEISIEAAYALQIIDEDFLRLCCRRGSPVSMLTQSFIDPDIQSRTPSSDSAMSAALQGLQRFRDLGFQPESSKYMETTLFQWVSVDLTRTERFFLNQRSLLCLIKEGIDISDADQLFGSQVRTHHLYKLLSILQPAKLLPSELERIVTAHQLHQFMYNLHRLQIPVTAERIQAAVDSSQKSSRLL